MPRSFRPRLVDILALVALAGLVVGLLVLQALGQPGEERGEDPAARSTPAGGGPVTHSTLGPTPSLTPPPTLVPSPTAGTVGGAAPSTGSSVPPATSGAAVPQPGADASELARSAQSLAARPSLFRVATFNVLGASHTRRSGDSRNKTPYQQRMALAVSVLANHGVDVVGFQEFESPQASDFARRTGAAWDMYPRPGARGVDGRQTIAWRTERLELVGTDTVTYPYFGGQTIHTPAVRLRLRDTGEEFWIFSVHNPATGCAVCGGDNDRWRRESVQREIAAIRRLGADGTPVLLVGDMNSKGAFYCQMSAALPVVFAAPGGSNDASGCRPPRPTPIDWIVGTQGIAFSGYLIDDSPLVDRATDHPVYSATAMLP